MLICAGLTGCATGYHDTRNPISGWTGGYWDRPGPGQLIQVGFDGNGYIDRPTITAYLMYHCAEVAHREHKPYMRIYSTLSAAILDRPEQEPAIGTIGGKLADSVYILLDDRNVSGDVSADATATKYAPLVQGREHHA